MAKTSWMRDFIVGLVFLGGLIAVGSTTLWLEGVPWSRTHALEIRLAEADNLKRGEPVLLSGVPVGQVQRIEYSPDPAGTGRNVLVGVSLSHDVTGALRRDARFTVRSAGPLGGRQMEIEPGTGALIDLEDPPVFEGEADGDIFRQLAEFVRENRGPLRDLIQSLNEVATDLEAAMNDIRAGKGLLGQLISSEQLATDTSSFMASARSVADGLSEGKGSIGKLLTDEEMAQSLSSFVNGLDDESGIVHLLLHDAAAKENLRTFVESASEIAREAREGKGLVAGLLSDEELANDVKTAFGDLKNVSGGLSEIIDKVQRGEGTLGKLVQEEEVWNEVVRLLVLARESIEDLREQAPISTFVNVIFAGF